MAKQQDFTTDEFRQLTNSRLIEALSLTDEDYQNIGRALAIGSHVQITGLSPISVQVGFEYTTLQEFQKYLESKGIKDIKAEESPTGRVHAYMGRIEVYAAGILY